MGSLSFIRELRFISLQNKKTVSLILINVKELTSFSPSWMYVSPVGTTCFKSSKPLLIFPLKIMYYNIKLKKNKQRLQQPFLKRCGGIATKVSSVRKGKNMSLKSR